MSSNPVQPVHPGYMTVRDISRIYRVTTAYVYKMANARKWRRYTLDGRVRYHAGDVDDTLGKGPALTKVSGG